MTTTRSRPFHVPEDLYPFKDHWFELGGSAMHYVDHGDGPPVVLLHGNPTWSFLYRDVIRRLGPEVRCLAPDYPGFGMSDHPPGYGYTPQEHADRVRAWLHHLDLPPFVLVVQDWGGPIGLSLAVEQPERIAGLVVLNTWAWPADAFSWIFSVAMGGPPLGRYLQLRRNVFATRLVRSGMYYAKQKPDAVFRAYRDPFPTPASRMGTYVFPRAIRTEGPWLTSIESRLPRLAHLPVELVWAMQDMAFGKETIIRRWQRHFPDAPVTRLAKASHFLQEDQPDAIAAAIRRVLGA